MYPRSHKQMVRRRFYRALAKSVGYVWPILSVLFALMAGLGLVVARLEGWHLFDGIYFAFVTGLTVGYGDLVPKSGLARGLAIVIGFNGILMTAIFAAIGVRALESAAREVSATEHSESGGKS